MHETLRTLSARVTGRMRRTGEQGASAVEYGLLVVLIAAVIAVAVLLLGGVVKGEFQDTKTNLCTNSNKGASQASACAKTN